MKLYQHYLIRIYPIGKPRKTVSVKTIIKHVPDYVFNQSFQRLKTHNNEAKLECKFKHFGMVVFYPVKSY